MASGQPQPPTTPRAVYIWIVAALVLLGFGLRLVNLATESLWYDEGISVGLASGPWHGFVAWPDAPAPPTIHPPLFYALLKLWLDIVGAGDFAARLPAVAFGLLCVPATAALARRLSGSRAVALTAALLTAISPFMVRYSQEARMYSLVALLVVLASLAVHRVATERRGHLLYAVAAALALYTHYFAAFAIVAQNMAMLAYLGRHRRRQDIGRWLRWQLVWLALYAPWLIYMLVFLRGAGDFWRQSYPLSFIVGHTIAVFGFGPEEIGAPSVLEQAPFWAAAALAAIALLRRPSAGLWTASAICFLALGVVMLGTYLSPIAVYTPRYLIVAAPAYYILLAIGIIRLGTTADGLRSASGGGRGDLTRGLARGLALALLLTLAVVSAAKLSALCITDVRGEDYRGLAAFLQPYIADGDRFVFSTGRMDHAFFYYLGERHEFSALSQRERYTAQSPLPEIERFGRDATVARVWLVESLVASQLLNDPDGVVASRLQEQLGVVVLGKRVAGLRARLYDRRAKAAYDATAPSGLIFGDTIELRGYGIEGSSFGGEMTVRLAWEARADVGRDYWASVQLMDDHNRLLALADYSLGNLVPSSTWEQGNRVLDEVRLRPPPAPSEGSRCLKVIVYDPATRDVLPVADAQGTTASPMLRCWQ